MSMQLEPQGFSQAARGARVLHPQWARVAAWVGLVAAVCLFLGTALFLADVAEWLAASPQFQETAAGYESDLANWYLAHFEHQRDILWSIALRDTLLVLSFIGFMVLWLPTAALAGWTRPVVQIGVLLAVVGGVIHIVNDVLFLGQIAYWRHESWSADPPGPMVAAGRAAEAIDASTTYLEVSGFVILAGSLVCLGIVCGGQPELPNWVAVAAYLEAFGMLLLAMTQALIGAETLRQVASLATGMVVGPAVLLALGRHTARAARKMGP